MPTKSSNAFTLIELLVVIVIIVILASFAYPVYTGIQERARVTQDMNNLRQIGLATQMYINDHDGVILDASTAWMSQLYPKYLPAWKIFQSPFDKRAASEAGDATTPVSYGLNGSIVGTLSDKISNPTAFILFAPAQTSDATVKFQGTASTGAPGVTVVGQGGNTAKSSPGGNATSGTHNKRQRIDACFADLHVENMLWSTFTDTTVTQRWSP